MNPKELTILKRIKHLEDAMAKGREFLENGSHATWSGFRPLYVEKIKDGKVQPPHKDWMRNVFLPNQERSLSKAYKLLEKVTEAGQRRAGAAR